MTPAQERLLHRIDAALVLGGDVMTRDDLLALARVGRVQIWGNDGGVCATELITYPRAKVCSIFLVAGDLAEVLALEPAVEEFAREHHCDAIVADGRPAWGRVGRRNGWSLHAFRYIRRLRTNGSARR